MDGIRWTEDELAAHLARRGHKAPAASPTAPGPTLATVDDKAVRPRGKLIKRPEQELQIAAIEALELVLYPNWRVFHVPNGNKLTKAARGTMAAMGLRSGFPDLGLCGPPAHRPAPFVVAEAKADRGKLRPAQEDWRDYFLGVGIPWFVFRTLDELEAGLLDAGVPLRGRLQ